LNPLRTAVPAAVGARYLAPEARVLCLFGTGQQSRAHVHTFTHAVSSITEVRVWSPTQAHREQFCEWAAKRYEQSLVCASSPAEAAAGAHIVAQTGHIPPGQPAFDMSWIEPGTLVITLTTGVPPEVECRRVVPSVSRPALIMPRFVPFSGPPGGP